jgi:sortase A
MDRTRSRRLAPVEASLWLLAATALGAAGFSYADAALYQRRHADTVFVLADTSDASPDRQGPLPALGTPIGRIAVPRLDLDVVVAEGTAPRILRRAVGRISTSALPGEGGNVAIAGHRDTFFRPLEAIAAGDVVILDSAAGRDAYRVEWTRVVGPEEVYVVSSTSYSALTLVTCYPFTYVGDAPQRFVVRARRIGDPTEAARAVAAVMVPTHG